MNASTNQRREGGATRLVAGAMLALALAVGGWFMLAPAARAPDVTFTSIKGEKIPVQSLQGKVVLVNFWATSCVTCVKKMPMIVDSFKKYAPQGYDVVAVAMKYDPANYVLNFVETRQLPFTVALDSMGDIAKAYGDVQLTPTAFLLDRDGRIVKRYLGDVDEKVFFADIEQALKS
jgi:peroxiredoxin